ncbi:MAG: DUF5995 family protein [Gemmatimonadota bacterium]|nr:DUF5995 family protein [Gemmatimonadota bacterium]
MAVQLTNARESRAAATTIDEVLAQLDAIIERAIAERDRLGFFAVLYRTVTASVKDGIAAGRFQDGPRMERLDVVFANRYLDALDRYRRGESPSHSWLVAFRAAAKRRPVIMQHLLLGMNAHINLDLGVAAAEVCPGDTLAGLEHDFNEINTVLATLETNVEREVCSLSPWIDRLDHIDPNAGRVVANFSMDKARACSWKTAQRLAPLAPVERAAEIDRLDRDIAVLAGLIERPIGFMLGLNLMLVRLRETGDARRVMATLRK